MIFAFFFCVVPNKIALSILVTMATKFKMAAQRVLVITSVLNNQIVPPTFYLCFTFTGINFRGMLHHVCDVLMAKTCVDQSELVNVGAQID